jgi:hypothetical protein
MVDRGVMDTIGVAAGIDVFLLVGIEDGVAVGSCVGSIGVTVTAGAQAASIKIPRNRALKIAFNSFLPKSVFCWHT